MSESCLIADRNGNVCGFRMEHCEKETAKRPKKGIPGTMMYTVECRQCGREFKVGPVYTDDAAEWLGLGGPRRHVQDVFPYLKPWEREAILGNMCKRCQDEIFRMLEEG